MSYDKNLLLSGGFEFDIYGWDISNKELTVTLRGHKHSVLKVALLQPSTTSNRRDEVYAVSADESGEVGYHMPWRHERRRRRPSRSGAAMKPPTS